MKNENDSACMSAQEVAIYLGISRSSAYQLFRHRGFPVLYTGPHRMVCPKDLLDKWIAEHAGQGWDEKTKGKGR